MPTLASGNLVIGGDKDGVQSSFYKRMAYMGVVEFKPNDQLHMLLDAYHSDFRRSADHPAHGIRHGLGGRDAHQPGPGRK